MDNDFVNQSRIASDFVNAVDLSSRLGFDAVEMHLGHGYLLSQFLSRKTNPVYAKDPYARLRYPLMILKSVCEKAHNTSNRKMGVLVKFNVSEATEEDLPLDDIRIFARAFYQAGADMLVPSGGHVMSNGLHMIRGGRPLEAMAKAQQNVIKKAVINWFGSYFVAEETYREAFFRERVISTMLGCGVPLSRVCLIGGVQDTATAESAIAVDGFSAVQLGRVLLADPDWCIKVGVAKDTSGKNICNSSLNICDKSNDCIVGATMALQPLRCAKYHSNDW
jgi:2,4-dienoyl-CoA reductase-like NADH-dependent reductase (Old Yellow Enzyme family)